MKVLIFGASGGTGRVLVPAALRQRHEVTAFVRSPAEFGMAGATLAVFTGNVTDRAAVERAMRGQDAVISVLGSSRPGQPGPDPGHVRAGPVDLVQAVGCDRRGGRAV